MQRTRAPRLSGDPPLPRGAHRLPVWRRMLFPFAGRSGDRAGARRQRPPARFPTGHYHGITVSIDPARAPDCLSCFLEDVEVRPSALIEKFCADSACFVTRSSQGVAHIFAELYSVPEAILQGLFQSQDPGAAAVFERVPRAGGPAAAQLPPVAGAARRADRRISAREHGAAADGRGALAALRRLGHAHQQQLSRRVRHVAGGVSARAENAWRCRLLRQTDRTVLDIAGQFGYDNGSKFAKAFRDVIGVSPNAYRSGIDCDSCAPEAPAV